MAKSLEYREPIILTEAGTERQLRTLRQSLVGTTGDVFNIYEIYKTYIIIKKYILISNSIFYLIYNLLNYFNHDI